MSVDTIRAIKFKKYVLSLDLQCREVFLKSCIECVTENTPLYLWLLNLLIIMEGDETKGEKKGATLDYNLWKDLFSIHYDNPEFQEIADRI